MSTHPAFNIEYFSPAIVRADPYVFCLKYSELGVNLMFDGVEKNLNSEGILYFPTPQQWDVRFPFVKGQRERIRSNIVTYSSESMHLKFIADFILDENKIANASKQREEERASITYVSSEEVAILRARILEKISEAQSLRPTNKFAEDIIRGTAYIGLFFLVLSIINLIIKNA